MQITIAARRRERVNNMTDLPEKIVRYDTIRVEYGKAKMCRCHSPHYEIDYQNRLVYCLDCGAVVDPLEALLSIARDTERWTEYTERLLEQRKQIEEYHPRRIILKDLEKRYIQTERHGLEPTCPHCGRPFPLKSLLSVPWSIPELCKLPEGEGGG